MCRPSYKHFETHYEEHVGKPWLDGLIKYMVTGPVVAMVWEG